MVHNYKVAYDWTECRVKVHNTIPGGCIEANKGEEYVVRAFIKKEQMKKLVLELAQASCGNRIGIDTSDMRELALEIKNLADELDKKGPQW